MEEPKNDKRSKWYDRGWATGCVFPLLVAIVTGVPSWFLSEYHTETQNVAEIAAKFDNVDEGMKYQDAINIIAQENENLKIEVNTLQQGSDSLTSQLQNKPGRPQGDGQRLQGRSGHQRQDLYCGRGH